MFGGGSEDSVSVVRVKYVEISGEKIMSVE